MSNKPLAPAPEGYHTVNPLIIAKGAAKLIKFLENVFEAKESTEARIPDTDGLIIHSEVQIGDSVIMIFDSKDNWPHTPAFLQVYVADATTVLERAKKAGSEIITELTNAWYGEKLARFRDPWGNLWWVHERTKEVDWETEAEKIEEAFQEAATSGKSGYIYDTLVEAMRNSDLTTNNGEHGQAKHSTRFLLELSNPARSALEYDGITTLEQLSKYSEKEILKLHGIGPASLPKLRKSLEEAGLSFRT